METHMPARDKFFKQTVLPILWILLSAAAEPDFSQERKTVPDITELSLEELMNIDVTLASRKKDKLFHAAAAMTVVSRDDIRRSGVTSIPEALRMVPGMEVARLDANKWAVSARGFNSLYSNKMLVLMDGRSLYSPVFSGVFWESLDVLLEDVDRIEVILGPGATLWGSNAVNGIINIISRDAKSTQGGFVGLGAGTVEKGFGSFRYGGRLGKNLFYRFSLKHSKRGPFVNSDGVPANDGWTMSTGEFRMDWEPSERSTFTVQGDLHAGTVGQEGKPTLFQEIKMGIPDNKTRLRSGNVIAKWFHRTSEKSDVSLRLSFDRSERKDTVVIGGEYNTFDMDFQHHFHWGSRHDVVWGTGCRVTRDRLQRDLMASMNPDRKTYGVLSVFAQDEIELAKNRLRLSIGSKFERNDFTGFEIQPNVRLLWTPEDRHTAWAAVSRAVHIPDRSDYDLQIRYDLQPLQFILSGNPELRSEKLIAYELGYHYRPLDGLLVNLNAFYNRYHSITNYNIGTVRIVPVPLSIQLPFFMDNLMSGFTAGCELGADYQVHKRIRLRGSYAYLKIRLTPSGETLARYAEFQKELNLDPNVINALLTSKTEKSPAHQVSLRGSAKVRTHLEADVNFRYVARLPGIGVGRYFGMDARLGWTPLSNLELYVVGQNLLEADHFEFDEQPSPFSSTRVQRGVYAGMNFRF
jgi:iron complex outermembrane receptor protein